MLTAASAPTEEQVALLRPSCNAAGNLILISIPKYSLHGFDASRSEVPNAAFSVPL